MNYDLLKVLNEKRRKFFTPEDIAGILGISNESAWVLCRRYLKRGIFVRIKKGFYVLESRLKYFEREDFFEIANFLRVPSYISFLTALSYWEATTQVPQTLFESVCLKRSGKLLFSEFEFDFYKVKPDYYFGFDKRDNFFIASKEKALVDCIYFSSMKKYSFDVYALNFSRFDKKNILKILEKYPKKILRFFNSLWKI